jgi:hypothetical protein
MNRNASEAVFAIFDEFRSRTEKLEPQILAKRISELNLSLSASDVAEVGRLIGRFFGGRGVFPVPPLLLPVISALIQDRHDKTIKMAFRRSSGTALVEGAGTRFSS